MNPIIFSSDATDFSTNGLGELTDTISCLVTEERNSVFECEFTYPITGIHYDRIQEGNIIVVSHDEQKDRQPFVIYRISRPINGVCVINAHHISYRLANVVVSPFTASSVTDAFNSLTANAMIENPFTFWTDKVSAGSMTVEVPTVCKSILGGKEGSILDSFGGGEYKWDNFVVRLYEHRGSNNGVSIRYGKNLTDITAERDTLGLYNAVVPFWSDRESTVVYGGVVVGNGGVRRTAEWTDENGTPIADENSNIIDFGYYVREVIVMDLSQDFSEKPTVAELEETARTKLNSSQPWIPKENIKVDFVALWQTEEYKDIAPLERVQLCDTVNVYYPELGVNATAKVIKVVWNALLERYDSIELGDTKSSFADTITNAIISDTDKKLEAIPTTSMMDEAINHATDLITGGLGGHIVFLYDADGKPTDMLIMDTDDVNTAVHVLRINVNGIGFSSTGVSGTYTSAWTLDGAFVADFITAGHFSCNRIQGGTLTLGGINNGNGVIVMYNASGVEIGRWDNTGFTQTYQNVYTWLGNGFITSYDNTNGKIVASTAPGMLITHNNANLYNSFSVVPQNGNFYSTEIASNLIYDAKIVGSTALETATTETIYIVERIGDGKYMKCVRLWNSGTADNNTWGGVKIIPNSIYAFGFMKPYSTDDFAIDTNHPVGALLDKGNNTIRFRAGTSDLTLIGNTSISLSGSSSSNSIGMSCGASSTPGHNPSFHIGGSQTGSGASQAASISLSASTMQGVYLSMQQNSLVLSLDTGATVSLQYNGSYWRIAGANQSGVIAVQGSSSKRYKHDITDDISEELDPHKLYELTMKQFVFNDDCESWEYPDMKGKTLPGFIAEDVEEIYPSAVIHNNDGDIENWDVRRIVPGMLKLIQEQHEEIESLKTRLAKLENVVEKLTNDMR